MKTYVEIRVPVNKRGKWLKDLKAELKEDVKKWTKVDCKYNTLFFHITLAYLNNVAGKERVKKLIGECINRHNVQRIVFDKIDAFTTRNGDEHIIYIGASKVPEEFVSFVTDLRETLLVAGCDLSPDFRLHATINRLNSKLIDIDSLRSKIKQVQPCNMELQLTDVRYRKGRSKSDTPSIEEYILKQRTDFH